MDKMTVSSTPLEGLLELQTKASGDARGKFARLFCDQDFGPVRQNLHFTQINLSDTKHKGTIRGMHLQFPPASEAKLIHCLRGRVFDVAVDVRANSPTFLKWHALELNEETGRAVFIPEGFAHGFQALSDDVQMLYMHTSSWSKQHEFGLRHDDPRLAIRWPLPVTMVSDKDADFDLLGPDFQGVSL